MKIPCNRSRLLLIRFAVGLLAVSSFVTASSEATPAKVLVVTVTTGFRHSSIPIAEQTLEALAAESGKFTVDFVRQPPGLPKFLFRPRPGPEGDQTPEYLARLAKYEEDKRAYDAAYAKWLPLVDVELAKLSPSNLRQYDAVIFASTTGDLPLPDKQGFIDWVAEGHAFIGVHAAADTFHGFPAFVEMLGGEFQRHGPQVSVDCVARDPEHAAVRHLPNPWTVFDEIYEFKNHDPKRVHGLLGLDRHPQTGEPGAYPVSWCKPFGQGRVFYTSLGHREDMWDSAVRMNDERKNDGSVALHYRQHLLGGILWALGLAPGDATVEGSAP